jgi:hypothetical protein
MEQTLSRRAAESDCPKPPPKTGKNTLKIWRASRPAVQRATALPRLIGLLAMGTEIPGNGLPLPDPAAQIELTTLALSSGRAPTAQLAAYGGVVETNNDEVER